ncbi:MAG: glycosyltransferase family 29 protein [Nanoarchaeota archaeon]|nr:glycosyltransferase family 29 protein [Nanoarchaeota archaeon]
MELEQGDVVICTVERIQGTTVFVSIEGNGEGYIVLSEIAPGRIRNLRDYVVPKKVIVCKVLRISGDRIELSLRRVTPKEEKEAKEQFKLEKSYKSIMKTVLKEECEKIIDEIKSKRNFFEFLEEAKKDPSKLQKICGTESSKKILEILNSQKKKVSSVKKEIKLRSQNPNGLEDIKKIFEKTKGVEVRYLSSGKYSLKAESDDIKKADNLVKEAIEEIEKLAKSLRINLTK